MAKANHGIEPGIITDQAEFSKIWLSTLTHRDEYRPGEIAYTYRQEQLDGLASAYPEFHAARIAAQVKAIAEGHS